MTLVVFNRHASNWIGSIPLLSKQRIEGGSIMVAALTGKWEGRQFWKWGEFRCR